MEYLKLGQSHMTRLALTPFFLAFYFKHKQGASNVIIFIGNADVDGLSVISDGIPVLT